MKLENNNELYSRLLVRAVYDDHTAWLMAELSRLAYIRFDDATKVLEKYIEEIGYLDIDEKESEFKRIIEKNLIQSNPQAGVEALSEELSERGFELVSTFSYAGANAYLAKRDLDRTAILVFRGIELSPADVRTELAWGGFHDLGNGRVHRGMWEAYRNLELSISNELSSLLDYNFYITGHSLGGGLAIIAARELSCPSIVACYTFGSPPVGDVYYGNNIAVPIYRIVNANDLVPHIAKAYTIDALISLTHMIPIRALRSRLVNLFYRIRGYCHYGEVHYLTSSMRRNHEIYMIVNPDKFDRFRSILSQLASGWKAGYKDHSIIEYSNKLKAFALRRWVDRE